MAAKFLNVILLLCVAQQVRTELFTALVDLKKVLVAERDIAQDIRHYIQQEEQRLHELRGIADDYEAHSRKHIDNAEVHLGNPVNSFLAVKRFTTDWEKVEYLIRNNTSEELMRKIDLKRENFPDTDDLTGAATALLRLQDTYRLTTESIAKGDFAEINKSPPLTSADCFELARTAYNLGDHYHTILWMTYTIDLMEGEVNTTVDKALAIDYLAYSTYMQGNLRHALTLTNELLLLEPHHQRAQNNKNYYEQMLAEETASQQKRGDDGTDAAEPKNEEVKNIRPLDDYRNSEEFSMYEALCRGEEGVPIKSPHTLTCQYRHNNNPLLLLQPAKEEIVNHKPWMAFYHQEMLDHEIAKVKELASPRLARATIQNSVTGKLEVAHYRISKSAWLRGEEHPILLNINRRIGALTALNQETAEELQVVNYGVGGHYEPHYDFARKSEKATFEEWRGNRIATFLLYKTETNTFDDWQGNRVATYIYYKEETNAFKSLGTGNRIATWIYYMTDVEAGGATVFPNIGVKVYPEKGSAAFWYNLHRSGEGDYETRHAACPVLVGSKWVANKWIHERGQEFYRGCSLSVDE